MKYKKKAKRLTALERVMLHATLFAMGYDLSIEPWDTIPKDVQREALRRMAWCSR